MVRQDSTQDTPNSQSHKTTKKLGLPAAVLRWRATSLMSGVGAAALVAGGLMLAPHATASGTEPVVLNPSGGTDSSNGLKVTIGGMGQVQVRRNNITQLYNLNETPDLGGNTNLHNGYYLTLTDNSGTVKAIGVNTGNMGDSSSVENRVDWTRVTVTPVAQSGQTYTTTLTMEYDDSDHGTYKLEIDFSYTSPNDYFTQTAKITAPSGNPYTVKHYQAYDTYLGGDDRGPGYYASAPNELVYVAGGAPASPVIQGIRAKSGKFDSYFAGNYLCLFSLNDAKCGSGASSGSFVLSATPLGNYTDATKDSEGAYPDSGIGVQYNAFAAGAAGTVSYSNDMVFTSPSVQIAKTGPANAGTSTDIKYTLKLTNNGTLPVSNDIAFKDYLPAGFVYKSVVGTNVTCNGTTDISCTLAGGLAPGATATATLTVTTPSGEGAFKNVAAVNKFGLADATLVPSKADCTSSPGPNCSAVDTTVAAGSADVTATVGNATIQAGASGTFDVTVANAAGATLPSGTTKVEFTLPADVTVNGSLPAGCTSDGATPAKITCETGDIAAGANQTLAIPVSVAAGAAVGDKTITPSASGGNDTDGVTTTAGTLTVSAANQAPTAGSDTANVEVNTATDIAVLTNDDDPDGPNANLVVQNLSTPTNGTATVNADKTVKYTPNTNYVGADSFTYEVCDAAGACATGTVNITVADTQKPEVTKPADVTTDQNAAITPITVTTSDNVGVTSTTVDGLPAGVTYDASSGQITGTPTVAGDFTATITSKDAAGNTTTETFKITVVDKEAPNVTKPAAVTTDQNAAITPITVTTSDNVGVTSTTVDGLPAGVTYDPNTGQITGTPTVAGESTVTVTAKDAAGNTTTETFKITVADTEKPSVEAIADQSKVLGSPIDAVTVTSGDNVGVTETTVTGLPDGVTYNSSDGTITGTPTAVRTSTVTVTVKDAAGNTSVEEFTIAVTAVPDTEAPKVTKPADVATDQNAAITPISLTTSDNVGVTEATVDGLPAGVTYDPNTGQITGTPTAAGESTVTVTAKDAAGNVTTETFKITVTDTENPKVVAVENQLKVLGSPIDAVTVTSSDNVGVTETTVTGLPDGVTYNSSDGTITGTPIAVGTSTVTVTVKDAAGNTSVEEFTIAVTQPADSDGDGIPDSVEKGSNPSSPVDTDKDGTPDFQDTDSDGDGIPDSVEKGPDGSKPADSDKDGVPDYLDQDSDGDGIPDSVEKGSDGKAPVDSDQDGTPDYLDQDSDGDGIPDKVEAGPDPKNPVDTDGDGKPDYRDLDSDGDGKPDKDEAGSDPANPVDSDKDGTPDFQQKPPADADGDGIPDSVEKGSDPSNPVDTDKDGTPDFQDTDSDGDGIPDSVEKGPDGSNPLDADKDETPNHLDSDSDGDGIPDSVEKGPDGNTPVDTDKDGTPDYLDQDSDGDGIPDKVEAGPDPSNPVDTDSDGKPDYLDLDSDGDGALDKDEAGSDPANPVDSDKDGTPDFQQKPTPSEGDSDGDGIPDSVEKGPDPSSPVDTDGDGTPDYQDSDSDGDGIPDSVEKGPDGSKPADTDGDGKPDYLDLDSDGDTVPDSTEAGKNPASPVDTDGDGKPDYQDLDSDGDGTPDKEEAGGGGKPPVDTDKDGTPDYVDQDSDGDGFPDSDESSTKDSDGDGIPDYQDPDVTVLKGQALDASGQPLRNATLEVTLANGVKLTTTTDGDGNYEFRSAPSQVLVAGIANVVVTTADGSKAEGAAELAKGRTTIRDLALEVKPVQRQTPQPRAKVPIQVKKPKRYLAKTGSEVTELLMAAGALVGLGGAVAETVRRRKRRNNQRVD